MPARRLAAVAILAGVVVVVALAWLARPSTRAASAVYPEVTIECAAMTGTDVDACRAWGDAILDRGPPSFTFEMDDLTRLRIHRSVLGFGSTCEVSYFTSRYPDDPVWSDEIPCTAAR